MNDLPAVVELTDLKTGRLAQLLASEEGPRSRYDRHLDTLFVLFTDPREEHVVHYVDDKVAVLYNPDTLEVIGFQIESFERRFLGDERTKRWRFSETGLAIQGFELEFYFVRPDPLGWVREFWPAVSEQARRRAVTLQVPVPA
ncbi:MAG: hypothetical protein NZM11_00745 [Anaerolineales bacterium]|nr:hypothetical protein [Anaerolineales bacterium]